jgi:hypothetical protein
MKTTCSRRDLLKGGAAASVAALTPLAGCMIFDGGSSLGEGNPANAGATSTNTDVATVLDPSAYEDRFSNVVDITDDPYNADPSGEEPIGDALSMAWEDDTLIVFPQGQYTMNQGFRRTGWRDIGLVGQNAVIRHGEVKAIDGHFVEEGEYRGSTMLFRIGTVNQPHQGEFVFGGFIFDWARENAGMHGLYAMIGDRAEIRNIAFNGVHDLGTHGNMRVATMAPDAFAHVDSIDMSGGGMHYDDTINSRSTTDYTGGVDEEGRGQSWSTTGIAGHTEMTGTTLFENCICGPWPDNGMYVQGGGRQIVRNCITSNSGTANIRFNDAGNWETIPEIDDGNDAYEQSTVENCVVIMDRLPSGVHHDQRGIWHYGGEGVVRNCEVTIAYESESGGTAGNFGIGTRSGVTSSLIENCQIQLFEPADAIYTSGSGVELRNVDIIAEGWDAGASPSAVIGGRTPRLENVTLNGSSY